MPTVSTDFTNCANAIEDHTRSTNITAKKTLTLALSLKWRGKNSLLERGAEKYSPSPLRGEGRGEEFILGAEQERMIINSSFE
jgi:hypothetical protein